jgi:RAB protein geranylgeranyltransferase component A
LAKAGKSVLHLDPNEYYGSDQASLTLDELAAWSQRVLSAEDDNAAGPSTTRYTNATTSPLTPQLENDRRRYALSLFPAILPSRGEMIDTLIKSQVSKYVSFRKLDSVALWQQQLSQATPGEGGDQAGPVEASVEERTGRQSGHIRRVPGSKEEVFKDKSVGLVDKRRLMKFLMFAAGDFESDDMLKGAFDPPVHSRSISASVS